MFSYLVGMYIYSRIVSTYLDSLSAPTTTTQTSVVALFNDTDDTQMINHSILSNCLVRITELYSRWQNRKIRCLRCRFLKVRLPQWRRLCRSMESRGRERQGSTGRLCPIRLPFTLFSILSSIILWSEFTIKQFRQFDFCGKLKIKQH